MKKTVAAIVFIMFMTSVAIASATDAPSVNGKWKVHSDIAGNESDITCTFVQAGNDLTGNCDTDQGKYDLTGKVDGKKIKWSFKSEYNGTPLTITYDGVIDASNKISGTTAVPDFGVEGEFSATK
jgi:opacity protein-like surface antigen